MQNKLSAAKIQFAALVKGNWGESIQLLKWMWVSQLIIISFMDIEEKVLIIDNCKKLTCQQERLPQLGLSHIVSIKNIYLQIENFKNFCKKF